MLGSVRCSSHSSPSQARQLVKMSQANIKIHKTVSECAWQRLHAYLRHARPQLLPAVVDAAIWMGCGRHSRAVQLAAQALHAHWDCRPAALACSSQGARLPGHGMQGNVQHGPV